MRWEYVFMLSFVLLLGADSKIQSKITRDNTRPMLTVAGKEINAHETQIMRNPLGDEPRYLMFAMFYAYCHEGPPAGGVTSCPKNYSDCGNRKDHNMSLYTSPNLQQDSWTFVSDQIFPMNTRPSGNYFRAKVLYHKPSTTWVLWVLHGNQAIVSTSSTPDGPFKIGAGNSTLLHRSGDLSIFVDDDENETAYVIYNANFKGIAIERLAPDYLSSLGETSGVFGIHPSEAPQLFKRKNTYYVFFDKTCCVCAWGSGVSVYTSSSPLGPFTYQAQINRDKEGHPTIHSQQCWMMILPNPEKSTEQQYIWIGDRWGSAKDGLHGNDLTYWQLMQWDDSRDPPIPENFTWVDSFIFNLTV